MTLELGTSLEQLPSELLDMITNKVREDCPKSFQALEQTSRGLIESARRCSKTLVVTPSKRVWGISAHERERGDDEQIEGVTPARSKLPKEILEKEWSLRPTLSKLVIGDTSYRREEEHCKYSILKTLTKFPWEEVQIGGTFCGQHCKSSCRTTWEQEFPQKIVSACATSIKRLILTGFDFRGERAILSFLEHLPALEILTLDGLYVGRPDTYFNPCVKHKELASLNIADLTCPVSGVFFSPVNRHLVPKSAALSANLPSLRQLSANAFDGSMRGHRCCRTQLLVEAPFFSFPSSLEVLELCWRHFSYEDFRPAPLFVMLERDCPQLQELHVRMDTPKTDDAKERSLKWISEQDKLPEGCPELRELTFEMSEKGGKWESVKSLRRA